MVPTGRLTISVAKDGMTATVVLHEGELFERTDLMGSLAAAGLVVGIDVDACEKVLDLDLDAEPLVIARGTPPVAATDGSFTLAWEPGIQPGRVREDGSIDFHERDLVKSVLAGELLGTLAPPIAGQPGQRVDGNPVPVAKGRPAAMTFGPGVIVEPGGAVRAARDGVVALRQGMSLDVTDRHTHGADVDLRSGDLHIAGVVTVQGSVARTFGVWASGDVEIRDAVDGGSVHAGGNVTVGGTVRGGDGCIVQAHGDIVVRTAESAAIHCGGKLRVGEAVSSHLAAKRVEVMRRVRGGVLIAEEAILVQEAGTPDGSLTLLVVGEPVAESLGVVLTVVDAAKRAREARRQPSGAPAPHRTGAYRASSSVSPASRAGPSTAPLSHRGGGGRPSLVGLQAVRPGAYRIASSRSSLPAIPVMEIRDAAALAAQREALAQVAFVHVAGVLHAGVVVQIGSARFNVDQSVRGVRFTLDPESKQVRVDSAHR